MTQIPDIQRAWTVVRRGTPSKALLLRDDWPVPKNLRTGEVLVKIQAAALNPAGYKVMKLLPNLLAGRPHVSELDFSGVVADANGTKFSNGDNVFGWVPMELQPKTRQGSLAEYVKVSADNIVIRPSNVTPVQAAGITLAALTAYQALIRHANIEPSQTVFINGGSTSVGAYAIQIAKARGAKVVATASGKNEEFVRQLGVDEFIDYPKTPLLEHLKKNPPSPKYQLIYECAGLTDPSLFSQSAPYLAGNGLFISVGPTPSTFAPSELWNFFRTICAATIPAWLGNVNRQYKFFMVKHNTADLQELQKLFADGSIKPVVDSVHDFEDVQEAYDRLMTGRSTGKVVVKVDPTVD